MTATASGRPAGEDVILTGIARSGTTLACALLNRLPGVVALHEPMSPAALSSLPSRAAINAEVAAFCAAQRGTLLERREAVSRVRDGAIPDNPYDDTPGPDGLRGSTVREGVVRFDKNLEPSFRLVIKHPSCFTALLDVLTERFRCLAIVRNPLAILLSWQTTRANWNDGRQPAAEAFDPGLQAALEAEPDVLGRQLLMLRWSFSAYARHLPADAVIRYEDIVSSGGAALVAVDPAAARLAEPLVERNASALYRGVAVGPLVERILATDGPWWEWYRRGDVEDLAVRLGG